MAYFSNGSEGQMLDEQCAACPLGESQCPILAVQLCYNYDQCQLGNETLREAMNMLVDEEGICLMRVELLKIGEGRSMK